MTTKVNENKRAIWASTRSMLESQNFKQKRSGKKSKSKWGYFETVTSIFGFFLKLAGLYEKGYQNAQNLVFNKITLEYPDLPGSFDSYKILHLSDLHIDSIPDFEQIIINKIKDIECDLCVMTGDYRKNIFGSYKNILEPIRKIITSITPKDGFIAVLGNHDTYLMADHENDFPGLNLLINETMQIARDKERIAITGTDDPFRYYTDQAIQALEAPNNCFKIALVHTSELHDIAAENGYQLYLCGHTHGGQICLPGGRPVITHQFEGKKFHAGLWETNGMKGYTHSGCGVSGIPLRYNCRGEITLFTLKKQISC